jgi:arginase
MKMTRRRFTAVSGIALLAGIPAGLLKANAKRISLVLAPSNLGLRPTERGDEPGTWQAPQSLLDAGLAHAINAQEVVRLARPTYHFEAQPGTRIRNGRSIRDFSLLLSEAVHDSLHARRFPVVVGGDCSVLLGSLHGLRLAGGRGLVHIDGHSDFSHPGNYDTTKRLGAVAGMDLALASGRGERLLTHWPGIGAPLASDMDIIQVGERNAGYSISHERTTIPRTGIYQLTAQNVLAGGIDAAARRVIAKLEARGLDKVWLHVDLDVLDQEVMPAVDAPGSPGFTYAQLSGFVDTLCASGRISGVNFTIYDPAQDPRGLYARPLVKCMADAVRGIA